MLIKILSLRILTLHTVKVMDNKNGGKFEKTKSASQTFKLVKP
jgi:hypothetical protein